MGNKGHIFKHEHNPPPPESNPIYVPTCMIVFSNHHVYTCIHLYYLIKIQKQIYQSFVRTEINLGKRLTRRKFNQFLFSTTSLQTCLTQNHNDRLSFERKMGKQIISYIYTMQCLRYDIALQVSVVGYCLPPSPNKRRRKSIK